MGGGRPVAASRPHRLGVVFLGELGNLRVDRRPLRLHLVVLVGQLRGELLFKCERCRLRGQILLQVCLRLFLLLEQGRHLAALAVEVGVGLRDLRVLLLHAHEQPAVDRFKSDIGFIPLSYDPRFISILAQDLLLAGALLGALGSYIGVRRYVRI